jgi:hypothetical protein
MILQLASRAYCTVSTHLVEMCPALLHACKSSNDLLSYQPFFVVPAMQTWPPRSEQLYVGRCSLVASHALSFSLHGAVNPKSPSLGTAAPLWCKVGSPAEECSMGFHS